jgi:hypothetical protein
VLKKTLVGSVMTMAMAVAAHAATPGTCGVFEGKYEGNDDHGFVRVAVARDGTVTGQAQSQVIDATFAIGGVVKGDGTLATSGAVSSGAQFNGRFVGNVAAGTWRNQVVVNGAPRTLTGSWGVERTASDGCQ